MSSSDIFYVDISSSRSNWKKLNNEKKLLKAINDDNIKRLTELRRIIKLNKVFKRNEKTFTALAYAIYHNHPKSVRHLISLGAHVNQSYTGSFENHLCEGIAMADLIQDLRIPIILLCAEAKENATSPYHPVFMSMYRFNIQLFDLMLAFGSYTQQEILLYSSHANGLITSSSYEEKNKQHIIESLQYYSKLQFQIVNPDVDSLIKIIENGFFGLTKQALQNGIQPKLEDLVWAKNQYLLLKKVEDYKSIEDYDNPFTSYDKQIYLQSFREIGKKLIKYLRLYEGVGSDTYPPITKKGITNTAIPKEIAQAIAQYIIS